VLNAHFHVYWVRLLRRWVARRLKVLSSAANPNRAEHTCSRATIDTVILNSMVIILSFISKVCGACSISDIESDG